MTAPTQSDSHHLYLPTETPAQPILAAPVAEKQPVTHQGHCVQLIPSLTPLNSLIFLLERTRFSYVPGLRARASNSPSRLSLSSHIALR